MNAYILHITPCSPLPDAIERCRVDTVDRSDGNSAQTALSTSYFANQNGIKRRLTAKLDVFRMRDGFEIGGIDASPVLAFMVQLFAFGHWPNVLFVRNDVSTSIGFVYPDIAVTRTCQTSLPVPTASYWVNVIAIRSNPASDLPLMPTQEKTRATDDFARRRIVVLRQLRLIPAPTQTQTGWVGTWVGDTFPPPSLFCSARRTANCVPRATNGNATIDTTQVILGMRHVLTSSIGRSVRRWTGLFQQVRSSFVPELYQFRQQN